MNKQRNILSIITILTHKTKLFNLLKKERVNCAMAYFITDISQIFGLARLTYLLLDY